MSKMEVINNNVECPVTIIEYNKSIIDQIIFLEKAKEHLQDIIDNRGEITIEDVKEALGYGKQ